jgi:predicted alpha/beta-hydrolase family hydrolase
MAAMRRALLAFVLTAVLPALAADHLVTIATRPGVKLGYWQMERPGATATVILLPGGEGGIGLKGGVPTSPNFLIRSRDLFTAEGFNVVLVGRPSDRQDLDLAFRASGEYVEDLRLVIERVSADLGKPVWLIGTSRGTVSAAAAAAALETPALAGIVLTSSVTYARDLPSVPVLRLADIRVPMLVMHHKRDACKSCDPREAKQIIDRATGAPVKKLLIVDGGGGAHGDPCEPMHYHGYIGMEKEAVRSIADWIRAPAP